MLLSATAGRRDAGRNRLAVILCGVSLMLTHRAVLSSVSWRKCAHDSCHRYATKTPLANIRSRHWPVIAGLRAYKVPPFSHPGNEQLGRLVDNMLPRELRM
jgi:hypothetical protein